MSAESKGTVLVVEDSVELRFILLAHLRAAGFTTWEAEDGYAGIRLAGEHRPDVIIMDLGLPKLNGIEATRALKGDPSTAAIPIIMLTGRSSSEDVVRGLEAGAQEYLAKPFDITELLARVRTVYRLACAHKDLDQLNNRLEAEVDTKTYRLEVLYEFMRDLNQARSHNEIFDLILRCARRITGASRLSLLMKAPASDHLVCVRAVGIKPEVVERIRFPSIEGVAGKVFQSGKTLSARSYGHSSDGPSPYQSDMFVSVPLVSTSLSTRDRTIGVLNITEKADNKAFGGEEIECIRSIADAAAIAIDNIDRHRQLQQSVRVLLQTVGHLAEYRDEETTLHLARVSQMARLLARQAQHEGAYADRISDRFISHLGQAAALHDIGKVGIPDDILTKPGKLTDEEFRIMKTHTEIGRQVLSQALDPAHPVPLLQMCIDIAHCHHERFDGSGYPRGLAGEDIPLTARIIALVDAYDAITSRRRYADARSHETAVAIIRSEAGAHFDPVLVKAFLGQHEHFNQIRARYEEETAAPEAVVA